MRLHDIIVHRFTLYNFFISFFVSQSDSSLTAPSPPSPSRRHRPLHSSEHAVTSSAFQSSSPPERVLPLGFLSIYTYHYQPLTTTPNQKCLRHHRQSRSSTANRCCRTSSQPQYRPHLCSGRRPAPPCAISGVIQIWICCRSGLRCKATATLSFSRRSPPFTTRHPVAVDATWRSTVRDPSPPPPASPLKLWNYTRRRSVGGGGGVKCRHS